MIGGGTAASVSAAAPLASSLPVELSAADRARVDQALLDSRAANTRAQYRSAWRGWAEWSALNGHATLPADPLADGRGIVVYVRQSKTDQDGTAADVRYLKRGCAAALRQLRDRLTVQRSGLRPDGTAQVLGGINGQSIARRLTAAASAAGIEGRITGHSGRVGLAVELTRRGAPEQATAKAGGWKSSRMVAHYSGGRRSRAGRRRYLPVGGAGSDRKRRGGSTSAVVFVNRGALVVAVGQVSGIGAA